MTKDILGPLVFPVLHQVAQREPLRHGELRPAHQTDTPGFVIPAVGVGSDLLESSPRDNPTVNKDDGVVPNMQKVRDRGRLFGVQLSLEPAGHMPEVDIEVVVFVASVRSLGAMDSLRFACIYHRYSHFAMVFQS